jgi:hypothetical protein
MAPNGLFLSIHGMRALSDILNFWNNYRAGENFFTAINPITIEEYEQHPDSISGSFEQTEDDEVLANEIFRRLKNVGYDV